MKGSALNPAPPEIVSVRTSRHDYDVVIGRGLLVELGALLRQHAPRLGRRVAVIADVNVARLYAEKTLQVLAAADYAPSLFRVPAGETSKALARAGEICEEMADAGFDRHSFVLALGGGVVGDLAGFVAAIYQRGIPVVQVPTTIMAQVDSSVGGKTGVNLAAGKNLVGAFWPPSFVLADVDTLATLPPREQNEGFAEVIKHGVIADAKMVLEMGRGGFQDLVGLVRRNVALKAGIVMEDEFERGGRRELLNFGHTVGHAIETVAGYGVLLHGEAIALGLRVAAAVSKTRFGFSADDSRLLDLALEKMQLPRHLTPEIGTDALLTALQRDKKFREGQIRFVVTPRLGSAFVAEDVTEAEIRAAIEEVRA